MRYRILAVVTLVALIFFWSSKLAMAFDEMIKLVPANAMVVTFVDVDRDDDGISFILKLWKKRLDSAKKRSYRRGEAIEEIYNKALPSKVVGAAFLKDKKSMPQYIIIVKVEGTARRGRQFDIFKRNLEILLKRYEDLQTTNYSGYEIIYREQRPGNEDPSAYTCIHNNIVIGSDVDILKKVIDTYIEGKATVAEDDKFIDMKSKLTGRCDGFMFINNKNANFTNFLGKWEEEYHMRLFLSGEVLDTIGISFDIVNRNVSKGEIIFTTRIPDTFFDDVQDDARFFDQMVKRKFIAEGVGYASDVIVDGKYVILNFKLAKLRHFWEKAFGRERKEIFKEKEIGRVVR